MKKKLCLEEMLHKRLQYFLKNWFKFYTRYVCLFFLVSCYYKIPTSLQGSQFSAPPTQKHSSRLLPLRDLSGSPGRLSRNSSVDV